MAANYERVHEKFHIQQLTDNQKTALGELTKGRDVFMCTKTGGGKSLVYQAFPICQTYPEDHCRVLVISPLVSIMKEQTCFLQSLGLTASYIGRSKDSDNDISSGKIQYIYSSPESVLQNQNWRNHLTTSSDIKLLVVDEAHTVIQWSEKSDGEQSFREWFGKLGELRSLIKCPMLVMTATVSKSARRKLKKKLALVDCCEIIDSLDRDNVKLFVKKVNTASPLLDVFSWIVEELQEKAASATRYVIFANAIAKCSQIMTMFQLHLPKDRLKHVNMFHSCTPEDVGVKRRY